MPRRLGVAQFFRGSMFAPDFCGLSASRAVAAVAVTSTTDHVTTSVNASATRAGR